MENLFDIVNALHAITWGPPTLIAMAGCGLYLTIRLSALPIRKLGVGLALMWEGRNPKGEGDISGFRALMTALAATIGTGNIAGVPVAISVGGPGALFWMWILALLGMATKYAEAVCAVHYRETDPFGKQMGGPMHYIKNGLGPKWKWLAFLFAAFGAVAAFGIGNMIQSNTIADAFDDKGVHPTFVAIALGSLVAFVLFGGITRIAAWASRLVPLMALIYVALALMVVLAHADKLPSAFALIISGAFTGTAATGGFAGATVWAAIRLGVARGAFSNEAGLGSAAIAHAAAQTNDPIRQGHVAMLGTFIDTIIVCTLTGLAVIVTGVWTNSETGADLTIQAFQTTIPAADNIIIAALVVFGFTTILGWSYYGEKCWQYIFGFRHVPLYRLLWVAAVFLGPMQLTLAGGTTKESINLLWLFFDALAALMAAPNLIALFMLTPVVVRLTQSYYEKQTPRAA